jgi:hypothetical protein
MPRDCSKGQVGIPSYLYSTVSDMNNVSRRPLVSDENVEKVMKIYLEYLNECRNVPHQKKERILREIDEYRASLNPEKQKKFDDMMKKLVLYIFVESSMMPKMKYRIVTKLPDDLQDTIGSSTYISGPAGLTNLTGLINPAELID